MDLTPLQIYTKCSLDEEGIYAHIRSALGRGLPLTPECEEHDGTAILVGSGPSVLGQIESIKKQRELGYPIVAIKDAHDLLISHGIIPDYAVAVDPQEHRWNCFTKKNSAVKYMIASQCHPAMFDHLEEMKVFLWHLYFKEGQTYPPNSILVTGGTTTGLRAITLFYSLGFRRFELYGYDCAMKDGAVRFTGEKSVEKIIDVIVAGKRFVCNTAMAAQATEFQNLYTCMPDMIVDSHGDGIITTIINERKRIPPISFIHAGGEEMASYRYRVRIPAEKLGWAINDYRAPTVIFSKPTVADVAAAREMKSRGQLIVADFCDDHFEHMPHYREMLSLADHVTCPTTEMAHRITQYLHLLNARISVIDDPYEFDLAPPHCAGENLLWFGHKVNAYSIMTLIPELNHPLRLVSNFEGSIPWSIPALYEEFKWADIVVVPKTAGYKSPNRVIESIRQGCFVVAEEHPSLMGFRDFIWRGDIVEGVEWALNNLQQANKMTQAGQEFIERFSPERVANAWKESVAWLISTSAAGKNTGTDG